PTASGTPTTGTAAVTATPAPTATGISGRPTEPVQPQNISNAFWGTTDGGVTWQSATLPTSEANLLCPLSAIVAPDLADPQDVFFLAALGALNLQDPTSILPGQVHFELWRSRDGGVTWQALTLPAAPNPVATVILSPYHLFVGATGDTLALGTNYSGQNQLFTSSDAGKTWQQVTASGNVPGTTTHPYLAFAGGANGTIVALTSNTGSSEKPVAAWASSDSAKTWKRLADLPVTVASGATLTGQLFAAAGGQTIYAVVHATATTTDAKAGPVTVARSTDAGATWTAIPWPTDATTNAPLGGALIGQLGIDFAVDAKGDAFAAPTVNDLAQQQDPTGPQSAGFYAVLAGQTQFTRVAQAPAAQETAFGLTVSLAPASALAPPTTTTPSATSTNVATVTIEPTATPATTGTPSATTTPAPIGTPTTDGLPTLWSNFGPITQFTSAPDTAGLLANVLP
ncbi:MAG: hypothetical protein H0X24_20455, partial [Ktedonobacterales bacterium]|nr:hypothetical protein [Ktedonobacterales bacterium]